MAYISGRTVPLPPLREVHIGTSASTEEESTNATTSIADGDAIHTPVEVGPHSTRMREVHIGTAASTEEESTNSTTSVADGGAIQTPVEVGPSSTRSGGADLHPILNPLREIHIERECDIRKEHDSYGENDDEARAKNRTAFIPCAFWTVVAVIVFWIYCQLVPMLTFAISCHGWRWWAAASLFLIPGAVLVFVSFRVFLLFRKLPTFDQVKENRDKSYDVKEKLLHHYLEKLKPVDEYAVTAGFEGEEKAEVVNVLNLLCGNCAHYSDEIGWLDDFKRFKELQRKQANKIIGYYSKLIGLKTAASPWKAVDVVCVFLNSTLMVVDLAKLYHRDVDRGSAFRLVFRWFLNIYISGELGQISETAAKAIGEQLKEPVKDSLSDLGWLDGDWAGTVAQSIPFVAKFAGKIVEGGVNAFFAIRMGRKAVAAFEPFVSDGR